MLIIKWNGLLFWRNMEEFPVYRIIRYLNKHKLMRLNLHDFGACFSINRVLLKYVHGVILLYKILVMK